MHSAMSVDWRNCHRPVHPDRMRGMAKLRQRRFRRWAGEMLIAAAAGPPTALLAEWLFPDVSEHLSLISGAVSGSVAVFCMVRWIGHWDDPRHVKRPHGQP